MEENVMWIIIGTSLSFLIIVIFLLIGWLRCKKRRESKPFANNSVKPDLYTPSVNLRHYNTADISSSSGSTDECGTVPVVSHSTALQSPIYIRSPSASFSKNPQIYQTRTISHIHKTRHKHNIVSSTSSDHNKSSDEDDVFVSRPPCQYGRVWISVYYNQENDQLIVFINKAKYIPGRGMSNSSRNIFCRVYLLPDEENFLQSQIRKRTLSPKFNETFTFHITSRDVSSRTIRISLYDLDKRNVRHSLGHLLIPLSSLDLNDPSLIFKDLEIHQRTSFLGEIELQLYCNPSSDRLRVTLSHLRNLQGIIIDETGVYLMVQVFHGRRLMKTKETATMTMNASELVLDEQFTFAVAGKHLDNCSICISVVLVNTTSSMSLKSPYGKVVLGSFMYCRGEQLLHWQDMTANPRTTVTRWHRLEPIRHTSEGIRD